MKHGLAAITLTALLAVAGCAVSGNFAGSISTAGLEWHSETDVAVALTDPAPSTEPQP